MPSGSSRVSWYTTSRECAALSNRSISSPSGMSRFTATMSARCTMTSAIRRSCRPRMLRSMVRSTAVKPASSGVEASSTTCRSWRTDPAFHPNSVRMARLSQPSAARRAGSPGCTTAGRLRVLRGLSWVGSESIISVHPLPFRMGIAIRIRIGNAELRQDLLLEGFHRFGVVVLVVIVTDQVQETMHCKMAEVMLERLLFLIGLLPHRLIGNRDIAKHARRVVIRGARAGRLQRRERQHVGRLVDAAPVQVEHANAGVVGQHDRQLGLADVLIDGLGGGRDGALDHGLGGGFISPAIGDNENLGDGED